MKKFPFGLDHDKVTEEFVAIANGLSSGEVIPQEVTYINHEAHDEFAVKTVTLKFAIKVNGKED